MKLIDLLVQELPKRGGWPDGAESVVQDADDSEFYFFTGGPVKNGGKSWWFVDSDNRNDNSKWIFFEGRNDIADDCNSAIVTRAQYESALAASQKPAWNGEGLPPVGAKVEFFINPRFGYCNDWIPAAGTEMEVVAHKTTTDGNDVAVCYWDEGGAGRSCCFVPESLKPLRTEAEKKHEAVLESICAVLEMAAQDYKREDEAKLIYEAIAAGKIPGVKLDD